MENIKQNFDDMSKYCFDNNIKFQCFFLPENHSFKGSEACVGFHIILKNELRGEMHLKVLSLQDVKNAISFYNSPVFPVPEINI